MNLTEISLLVRRIISSLIALSILGLIFLILSPVTSTVYRTIFPPKDLPNTAFGKLEKVAFTTKTAIMEDPKYTLNTRTGRLPINLPIKMTVYKFLEPQISFEDGKIAQENAETLGFLPKDLISDLKGDQYAWRDANHGGVLEISIRDKNIKLLTPLARLSDEFPSGRVTQTSAKERANNILKELDRLNDPLYLTGTYEVILGRWRGNQVVETISTLDAQIARVDLFRFIDDFPILGPDSKKGLIHMFLQLPDATIATSLEYPKLETSIKTIDTENTGTYPIINVEQAWDQITQGNGIIANVTPESLSPFSDYNNSAEISEIIINNVYLAYYESLFYQQYLQPIYVFEGNYNANRGESGSITYYYPAIPAEYTFEEITEFESTPEVTDN